jgi:Ca-activated chloride channel family protein
MSFLHPEFAIGMTVVALIIVLVCRYRSWRDSKAILAFCLNWRAYASDLVWTPRRCTVFLPSFFAIAGFALLLLSIAAPFDWREMKLVDVDGVAIELVVDRSGSMRADDYRLNNRRITRLDAVSDAASRFVLGDQKNASRYRDMIGLITFARYADRACALTLDHEQVVAELQRIRTAPDYHEDGTAIGDGLALAIAELKSLQTSLGNLRGQKLSKVIVLLTDGQSNAGEITPQQSFQLAHRYNTRVYVIGLQSGLLESEVARSRTENERDRLTELAASTGGRYFTVGDTEMLNKVYRSIDSLERSNVGQRPLRIRRHWAVEWFEIGGFQMPPLGLISLFCFSLSLLLKDTVYAPLWNVA